jgi:radical SAM-linked protein
MSVLTSPLQAHQPVNPRTLEGLVLPNVHKPGRYLGIEQGAYQKSFDQAEVRMALAFPDLYEIGISNYAIKLLYSLVNQIDFAMCDRTYAPALDFKAELAKHHLPLYGVESKRPLAAFDMLAVSLQYELNYTTILGLLESAQIPFRAVNRPTLTLSGGDFPLLLAGGPGATHPAPLSPFFDAFMIGDGEHMLAEVLDCIRAFKQDARQNSALTKADMLAELAKIDGLYVPNVTTKAYKRIVDIAETHVDIAPLIPTVGAVHDRVTIEARRGCDRMCRFCQPCFINLPVREQSIEQIKTAALKEIEKTGYEECSLLSLSIADYSHFKPMILEVAGALSDKGISLSLPSQRADRFSLEVAEAVQSVRKSTLTFAPEAGTPRLRDVINKNLTDEEILEAVTTSYKAGWNKVKLYFIIGLPTETTADLDGIVDMVARLKSACRQLKRDTSLTIKDNLEVNVTLSNFVPKPHTPFQWFAGETMESMREKNTYIVKRFKGMPGVKVNYTDPEISKLETLITKGDAGLADVLEDAYRRGAYLDAWGEQSSITAWLEAVDAAGLDIEAYTTQRLTNPDEALPWDCIDVGLTKDWLKAEYAKALQAASTTPCFETCSTCGVCATYSTWPKFIDTPDASVGAKPVLRRLNPLPLGEGRVRENLQESNDQSTMSISNQELPHPTLSRGERGKGKNHPPQFDQPDAVATVRLTVQKRGALRFISHLDWMRLLQRAIQRAGLPVAQSKGFNPRPKLSFSPALPMFCEGQAEYLDIDLTQTQADLGTDWLTRINQHLPTEGQVTAHTWLPLHSPNIEQLITRLDYTARWLPAPDAPMVTQAEMQAHITALNAVGHVVVQSDNQTYPVSLADCPLTLCADNQTLALSIIVGRSDKKQLVYPAKPSQVLAGVAAGLPHGVVWQLSRTGIVLGGG